MAVRAADGLVGVYNATLGTLTDGQGASPALTNQGILLAYLSALIEGENQTYHRLMTMPKYTYSPVSKVSHQVKGAPGILHSVTFSCDDAAPTAGTVKIFDNPAATGTIVFNHTFKTTPFVTFTLTLDYDMLAGIYIEFTTTGDVNVSSGFL